MPRIVVLSLVASLAACQLPPSEPSAPPARTTDALLSTEPGAANVAFRHWLARYLARSDRKSGV